MAFLFGKKKGTQAHRDAPSTGAAAAAAAAAATSTTSAHGPTPSSSLNSSLNGFPNSAGGTPPPETKNVAGNTPLQQQRPQTAQAAQQQQQQQQQQSEVKAGITPTQSITSQPSAPAQLSPANASLYPWSQRRLSPPPSHPSPFPRYGHAANGVAGKEGDIYVMGGLIRSQTVRGDLWMVEGGGSQLSAYPVVTTSEGPGPRVGHASLLVGNAFIVFGGDTKLDERDVLDETLYLLNTSTRQWSRASPLGPRPSGRYGHTINILGSKLYIFGGQVDGFFFNDLVAFDLNTLQSVGSRWEVLIPAVEGSPDIPASRTNHTIVAWGDKLYLFGGTNGNIWFNDVWAYDPRLNAWSQLDCIGYIPAPREGHAAALVGDVMYIFGGRTSEGTDLGDLAAFRISSRRWYTFQNMGPSPSPRSGHSMTTCGTRIIVLGGEPSVPAVSQDELQLIYILDTSKIRYPNDQQTQQGSPTDRNSAKRVVQGRNGSIDAASPGPGPDGRGAPRRIPRESITGTGASPMAAGGTPLTTNNTSGGSVSSRLPRASIAQAPAGPPPTQQAPPPKTNGVIPAPRSKTPTGPGQKPKEVASPIQQNNPAAANVNGRRTPTNQQKKDSKDVTPGILPVVMEDSKNKPIGNRQADRGMDGMTSPTSPVPEQSQLPPLLQVGPQQQQKPLTNGNSPSNSSAPPLEISKTAATVDTGISPVQDSDKDSTSSSSSELERLRQKNDWYASELALARRSGYTLQTNNNSIFDERGTELLAEDERPFVEAMLALKSELVKVQGSVDSQSALAAKKIQAVERQRDVAIQEAVYAKAKLAALGGNNSATPTPGDKSVAEIQAMDAEKMADMSRKLAASLYAQAELSARLEVVNAEVAAERKARHLADETAGVAQSRVTELDEFRNRAASEMESLRAELLDAERAFRDEAASGAEASSDAKLLRLDQEELKAKFNEIVEDNESYRNSLEELNFAMVAVTARSETLARQLEEERVVKEGLERKLAQTKSEYEEKAAELQSANQRLKDAEELMDKYADEARTANAAMVAGLQRVSEKEVPNTTGSAADERVQILEEQVATTKTLLFKSKAQADETGERLVQAMQRVAGLEFQQGQASKDAIALRRRMAEVLDEVRRLKQETAEANARLLDRQLEIDSVTTKHIALKEILAERSSQIGFDKRRSRNLQSPSPGSGTATPEQINRLRELEQRLEDSLRAHRETKSTAEMQAQEVEKHFREKLEQLENDYQSAVHYVKGTEKMLRRMKDELTKYKAQNARMHLDLEEAQRKVSEISRQDTRSEAAERWEEDKELLNREVDDLRAKVRESALALDKQLRETKEQLDTLRTERDDFKLQHNQLQLQVLDLSQESSQTRSILDRLEHENAQLEIRARDAEEKVSMLLDQVENSVDAYRRSTKPENPTDIVSTRSSYYSGPDGRTSVALDSLATELDALRNHWETTNKNYRLSNTFDFEKTPTSTEGGELSSSLAKWRQKLDQEEAEAMRSESGEEEETPPGTGNGRPVKGFSGGGQMNGISLGREVM